jgi:branched-chain amino acid transport system substrate-binding protein
VRSNRPEFLLFISSTISDLKLGLEKLNEFRLAKGAVPIIANGAHGRTGGAQECRPPT